MKRSKNSVTSANNENWLIGELGKFILFLKELGTTHRIQNFAIALSKDKPTIPRLYSSPI
ncbi:hypothetical protein [Bacteroides acidifaciens]|uniref:hypothetical protein n=1 Tax=Bacteroides acidifaciens TaxID=85831 RepID=UPI00259673B0|nr:hypothetical protein [Bacteroides acidifaciens]